MIKQGYFRKDDSDHWYLIPKDKVKRFSSLIDEINSCENWEVRDALCGAVIEEFDEYRISGWIGDYEVTINE